MAQVPPPVAASTPSVSIPAATASASATQSASDAFGTQAMAAARKKTEDMTPEEKAAETALNQQLLVAKGVLFLGVIGYFAFTSL